VQGLQVLHVLFSTRDVYPPQKKKRRRKAQRTVEFIIPESDSNSTVYYLDWALFT
jgi:hypothetical protein